jgi:hypothetical protein
MQQFEVYGIGSEVYGGIVVQHNCGWTAQIDTDDALGLAELVQRAEQHAEVCEW